MVAARIPALRGRRVCAESFGVSGRDRAAGFDGCGERPPTTRAGPSIHNTFTETQFRLDEKDALMDRVTATASASFLVLPGFSEHQPLGSMLYA